MMRSARRLGHSFSTGARLRELRFVGCQRRQRARFCQTALELTCPDFLSTLRCGGSPGRAPGAFRRSHLVWGLRLLLAQPTRGGSRSPVKAWTVPGARLAEFLQWRSDITSTVAARHKPATNPETTVAGPWLVAWRTRQLLAVLLLLGLLLVLSQPNCQPGQPEWDRPGGHAVASTISKLGICRTHVLRQLARFRAADVGHALPGRCAVCAAPTMG